MSQHPLCFVLMPFGQKKDPASARTIDFDRIYREAIHPAVIDAELEPIRADEELAGGIIHKPMFERLMLCDYAVADLTTANANVFYELGVRHAVRPCTTLALFASGQALPFDVSFLRGIPYALGAELSSEVAAELRGNLTSRLRELRRGQQQVAACDSPVFQLLPDYRAPDIDRLKTDLFRERAVYAASVKEALAEARGKGEPAAVHAVEDGLGEVADAEAGVVIDLYLSYRAVADWRAMVDLYRRMAVALQRSVLVREQLGFAYNRLGERQKALGVLGDVIAEHGPSSETNGLLGRVYKDLWCDAQRGNRGAAARGHLAQAIEAYRAGFEADFRDAYPGINLLTLLDIRGDAEDLAERERLLPVVRYAVERRLASKQADYWDFATLVELAVLGRSRVEAERNLARALAAVREGWEPTTTANNLELIRQARAARGEGEPWLDDVIAALRDEAEARTAAT